MCARVYASRIHARTHTNPHAQATRTCPAEWRRSHRRSMPTTLPNTFSPWAPRASLSLSLRFALLPPPSPPLSLLSVPVSVCLSTYAFRASFVRFAHVYPPTSFANPACTCSRVHANAHPRMHTQANSSSTTRTTQCVAPWSFVRAHCHGQPPLHLPRRHRRPHRRPPRKRPRRRRRLPPLPPPPPADRCVCVVAAVPVSAGDRVCARVGGCA